jgi:hypothetical protein
MLEGSTSELQPHLNHEVQIMGRLASGSSTGSPSSTPPTSSTSPTGSTTGSQNAQRLTVESVKMIASTCTEPK